MDHLPVHPITGEPAVGIVNGRPVFRIAGGDERAEGAIATRLAAIDDELATVRSELVELSELDELTDEQTTRFDELESRHDELTTEREPVARRADTIRRAREQMRSGRGIERMGNRGPEVNSRIQPFGDLAAVRSGSLSAGEVQSRALAALDQAPEGVLSDAGRARAEALLRRNDRRGLIARHILLTGSDEYARAFEGILMGGQPWNLDDDARRALQFADEQRRALAEGTDAQGGYLVPYFLDPTLILTNAGTVNPFRALSRVETIATNKWHGVSSSGVTAEWLAEGGVPGDDSPNYSGPAVDVHSAGAYIQATFEVMQDTGVVGQLGELLGDAKDRLESAAFAVGTGTGQPKGIITAVSANAGSIVRAASQGTAGTSSDTYTVDDVYAMARSLSPRYRKRAAWAMSLDAILATRQFAQGPSYAISAFWADLGMDNPPELLGKPVHESSEMVGPNELAGAVGSQTANYVQALGDFRNYLIVDRIGMTVQYEPLVKDTATGRPNGQAGWFAHWRVGADALNTDAFRLLNVES